MSMVCYGVLVPSVGCLSKADSNQVKPGSPVYVTLNISFFLPLSGYVLAGQKTCYSCLGVYICSTG